MIATALLVGAGVFAAFYLYARYIRWHNTAIFTKFRDDVPIAGDAEPLIGNTGAFKRNAARRLDRFLELAEKHGTSWSGE